MLDCVPAIITLELVLGSLDLDGHDPAEELEVQIYQDGTPCLMVSSTPAAT